MEAHAQYNEHHPNQEPQEDHAMTENHEINPVQHIKEQSEFFTLQEQLREMEARVEESRKREMRDVARQLREIIELYEIPPHMLGFKSAEKRQGGGGRTRTRARTGKLYVNPDNPDEQWVGQGRKPNWLLAKLEEGYELNDFLAADSTSSESEESEED